jgi:hypothetical protein
VPVDVTEIVIARQHDEVAAFGAGPDGATQRYQNIKTVDSDRHRRCRSAPGLRSSPIDRATRGR